MSYIQPFTKIWQYKPILNTNISSNIYHSKLFKNTAMNPTLTYALFISTVIGYTCHLKELRKRKWMLRILNIRMHHLYYEKLLWLFYFHIKQILGHWILVLWKKQPFKCKKEVITVKNFYIKRSQAFYKRESIPQ